MAIRKTGSLSRTSLPALLVLFFSSSLWAVESGSVGNRLTEACLSYLNPSHVGSALEPVAIRFAVRGLVAQSAGERGESRAGRFLPARFLSGSLPSQPARTQGGGQVLIELLVDTSGGVSNANVLRSTPPFTSLLREAVMDWRFEPARAAGETEEHGPVESSVLVAGWFRPPTLYSTAMPGEPPKEVAEPSVDLAYPTSTVTPGYPPEGRGDQMVLVEVEVAKDGTVVDAKVLRSGGGFDAVALVAARHWKFRPAQWEGEAVHSFSYIVFGFREPVVPAKR